MFRDVDVNLIAYQIVATTTGRDKGMGEAVRSQFERLTRGLVEYERQRVAWLVNFRLAAPVL